jgi:Domain of Unknown Function (DUF928)
MTNNRKFWLAAIFWVLSLVVTTDIAWPNSTWAGPKTEQGSRPGKLLFSVSERTRKKQAVLTRNGVRRRMAGVRGGDTPIALIPQVNGRYIGTTLASHPTFWFYLPAITPKLQSVQLRLFDQTQKEVWAVQTTGEMLPMSAGLLKISYTGQPLKDGLYFWELTYQNEHQVTGLASSREDRSTATGLSGYLEKETSVNLVLPQKIPDRLRTYASNGIWYDLLTELIALRQLNSTDRQLEADFRSLIFDSPAVKYFLPGDPSKADLEIMERIVNGQVLNCCRFIPMQP